MHPAKQLKVWDAADELAGELRDAVARFPRGRTFGLADQLVRSAESIGANISEGCGRLTVPDQVHFYNRSQTSAQETLNHLKRCWRARLMDEKTYYRYSNRTTAIYRMLGALIRRVQRQ
jgi:four helix bundle protein